MPLEKNWKKITINYPHWNYPIYLLQIQVIVSIHLKSMHKSKKSCLFLLFLKTKKICNYGALNKEWRLSNKRGWSCKLLVHLDEWNPHKTWENGQHLLSNLAWRRRRSSSSVCPLARARGGRWPIYSRLISTGWWLQPVLNWGADTDAPQVSTGWSHQLVLMGSQGHCSVCPVLNWDVSTSRKCDRY